METSAAVASAAVWAHRVTFNVDDDDASTMTPLPEEYWLMEYLPVPTSTVTVTSLETSSEIRTAKAGTDVDAREMVTSASYIEYETGRNPKNNRCSADSGATVKTPTSAIVKD